MQILKKKTWSIYHDENKENIQQTGNLNHTYKFLFLFFFLHSPDCPPTCLSHCLCVRIVSKGRELAERSHVEWFCQNGTNSQPGLFGPFLSIPFESIHYLRLFQGFVFWWTPFLSAGSVGNRKATSTNNQVSAQAVFRTLDLSNCQCLSSSKHVISKCTCQLIGASLTNLKIFCSFLLKKLINHFFQIPLILSYCSVFTYLEWEACTSGYVASSNTTRALSWRKRIRTSSKNTILLKI